MISSKSSDSNQPASKHLVYCHFLQKRNLQHPEIHRKDLCLRKQEIANCTIIIEVVSKRLALSEFAEAERTWN